MVQWVAYRSLYMYTSYGYFLTRRGSQDIQRRARQEAMGLLREYGERGQVALRAAAGLQPASTANAMPTSVATPPQQPTAVVYQQPQGGYIVQQYPQQQQQPVGGTGDVLDEVHNLIEVAAGHAELLEEMVLAMTSEEEDEFGANLCGDLVSEIHALKQKFPNALERLTVQTSPEAETLMKAALEASDSLDNVLALYQSVYLAKQQQQEQQPQTNNHTSQESTPVPTSQPSPAVTGSAVPPPNLMDTPYVPIQPPPSSTLQVSQPPPQPQPQQQQQQQYQPSKDDPFGLDELSVGLASTVHTQQVQQPSAAQQPLFNDPFMASQQAPVMMTNSATATATNPFTGTSTANKSVSGTVGNNSEQSNVDKEWDKYFPGKDASKTEAQETQQGTN
eukprot:TRINITY_DN3295_c0_g1_i5.p1 TRINITY_DN3295_c0_g1~~TRINITY_DN3295_c0_g1_i5.p1  ORF type:complete len:391 (-),score=83.57 TRINITY_DN3295_c0_g1_i5:320-1492(-)